VVNVGRKGEKKKSKKKLRKKKSAGPKLYFPARTPTPLDNCPGNYYQQAREWVEMEHAHWSERIHYQTHVVRARARIYIKDNNSLGTIGGKASGVASEGIFYLIENKGNKVVVSLPTLMLCSPGSQLTTEKISFPQVNSNHNHKPN
jgi:hypothetical protein